MRKATVTVSYDEEKLGALKIYLAQKGMDLDDELIMAVDHLYSKHVPSAVKDFFEMKNELDKSVKKPEVKSNGK